MALRAGYWGIKKLLSPLKLFKPGELGIDNDALVEDLNPVFFPRSEQAVLGAENILLPNTLADIKAQNTTGTWNDNVYSLNNVEFTINTNGTVTVSITGSVSTNAVIKAVYKLKAVNGIEYTISDFLSNVDREKIRLWANSSTAFPAGKRLTTGTETAYQSSTQIAMADEDVPISIEILNGATLSSAVVFKGMVSLDTDPTYALYAMTNKELTDAISNISSGWDYSTSEVDTGQKWIDGRPIYCKVIALENAITASAGSWTSTGVSSAGVDILLNISSAADACTNLRGSNKVGTTEEFHVQSYYGNISVTTVIVYYLKVANRAAQDEPAADPDTATRSTKKTTKKTASADTNE